MRSQQGQVVLGARVPSHLKEVLSNYCIRHGIKIGYFVTEAIKAKLQEIREGSYDIVVSKKRLKNARFLSEKEFGKYLSRRGIDS